MDQAKTAAIPARSILVCPVKRTIVLAFVASKTRFDAVLPGSAFPFK
jgi:hypothetical protein